MILYFWIYSATTSQNVALRETLHKITYCGTFVEYFLEEGHADYRGILYKTLSSLLLDVIAGPIYIKRRPTHCTRNIRDSDVATAHMSLIVCFIHLDFFSLEIFFSGKLTNVINLFIPQPGAPEK